MSCGAERKGRSGLYAALEGLIDSFPHHSSEYLMCEPMRWTANPSNRKGRGPKGVKRLLSRLHVCCRLKLELATEDSVLFCERGAGRTPADW